MKYFIAKNMNGEPCNYTAGSYNGINEMGNYQWLEYYRHPRQSYVTFGLASLGDVAFTEYIDGTAISVAISWNPYAILIKYRYYYSQISIFHLVMHCQLLFYSTTNLLLLNQHILFYSALNTSVRKIKMSRKHSNNSNYPRRNEKE